MVTAPRHCTWMDEESFKKTCIKENGKRGGIQQPFYSTWVVDFMLRQDARKFMLGKYLSDKKQSLKDLYQGEGKKGRQPPAVLRADFTLKQDAGMFMLGKY